MIDEEWTEALAERLRSAQNPAPPAALSVVDALNEMLEWVDDPRPFEPRYHTKGWTSAWSDVVAALSRAGRLTRDGCEQVLGTWKPEDAIDRGTTSGDRRHDFNLLGAAVSAVTSNEGVRSAWLDTVTKAQSSMRDETWSELHDLHRILESRGRKSDQVFSAVAAVIEDNLLGIEDALMRIDPEYRSSIADPRLVANELAGRSVQERIGIATELLCTKLPMAHFIVWLGIDRAELDRGQLMVGRFSFFHAGTVLSTLDQPSAERSDWFPQEIRTTNLPAGAFPAGDHVVLARVDMGERSGSFVAEDARAELLSLLALSDRANADHWRVMPGSVVFRNGERSGWSTFRDVKELTSARRIGEVATWLDDEGRKVEAALPAVPGSDLDRLLRLAEWDAQHSTQDPLTTVLLAVRSIETVSQSFLGGRPWSELVKLYADHWSWFQIQHELASLAGEVFWKDHELPNATDRVRLGEISGDAIRSTETRTMTDLAKFLLHVPELQEIWAHDPRQVRVLEDARMVWTDRKLFEHRLSAFAADTELRIDRLTRIRNAVQHGGPCSTESVRSVATFAHDIRRVSLLDMAHGLLDGRSCRDTVESIERLTSDRRKRLRSTGSPIKALETRARFEPAASS